MKLGHTVCGRAKRLIGLERLLMLHHVLYSVPLSEDKFGRPLLVS